MSSNKPFPSSDLDVFKENSLILDQFVNSQENEYPDRFARKRPTITGIIKEAFNVRTDISNMNETLIGQSRWDAVPKNTSLSLGGDNGALNKQAQALFNRTEMLKVHAREALRRTYQEVGLNLVEGSFEQGGILQSVTDVILEEKTGKVYSWTGGFPKVVNKGTLPSSELEYLEIVTTLSEMLANPAGYKSIGDGVVGRLSVLLEKFSLTDVWEEAKKYRIFHIDVDMEKTVTYEIQNNQTVIIDSVIKHVTKTPCFLAQGVSGWRVTGNGWVLGGTERPLLQNPTHFGLVIIDCFRYLIDGKLRFKYFSAVGLYGDGSSEVSGDVSFSSVSGVNCEENHVNFQLMNGFQQEYTTFSGCWGVRATFANMILETGNIFWQGGGLSHGYGHGLILQHPSNGGNPHHGVFSGTEFNHNAGHNVLAFKVAYGMVFVGCTFFSGGSTDKGDIYINNSRLVTFVNGILGCDVRVVEDTSEPHYGFNTIAGMTVFRTDWADSARIITGGSFSRKKLLVKDNYTLSGPWEYNNLGGKGCYVNARLNNNFRMTSATTTIKMDNVLADQMDVYDKTTGVFTMPFYGGLRVNVNLELITNSDVKVAGHKLLFFRDDGGTGNAYTLLGSLRPTSGSGNTSASINGVFEIPVSRGGKVLVQYQAPDFATQLCDINKDTSFISFEVF